MISAVGRERGRARANVIVAVAHVRRVGEPEPWTL